MGSQRSFYPVIGKIRRFTFLSFLFLFLLSFTRLFSATTESSVDIQGKDTVYHLTPHDIKAGERLFFGVMRNQEGQAPCVSCHNVHPVKEVNWSPSALDIATFIESKSLEDLKTVLQNPSGKRQSQAHALVKTLSDDEVVKIKGFLHGYFERGGHPVKPIIDRLLYFLGLVALFLLAFLDLVWFRVIRYRLIHALVLLLCTGFISKVLVEESIAIGRSKNYTPDQPIKFSHKVHAGQNHIDCQYCHSGAEFGKSAEIPAASVCLNCHMVVREGTRSGRYEINKIFAALESKKPIPWIRVYNLPDHVFFSHAQHVGAGKLTCQTCHGPVEQMDRIVQVPDLSMGWCINCHRDTKVQFHDNAFYSNYDVLRKKIEKDQIDSVTVDMVGGTDCMKCHY
jgi:cytochrome c553